MWPGGGLFIKQHEPSDPSTAVTLENEARFYEACADARADLPIPKRVLIEERGIALALALVPDCTNLGEVENLGKRMPTIYEALGRALARFHELSSSSGFRETVFAKTLGQPEPPWVLSIGKPGPELLETLSPANVETLQIIQGDSGLAAHLETVWRMLEPTSLIHGDLKADNILVSTNSSDDPGIVLVDWEMVQRGDAAWDVGAIFQDLLEAWLRTTGRKRGSDMELLVESASPSLRSAQTGYRAFWGAYVSGRNFSMAKRDDFLRRVVICCAAQLVQRTFAGEQSSNQISSRAVDTLRVAANLFRSPDAGTLLIFGLPPPRSRSASSRGS